jgi:hypothetical protein
MSDWTYSDLFQQLALNTRHVTSGPRGKWRELKRPRCKLQMPGSSETKRARLSGPLMIGGAEEDRTPDLRIANATLSQLSYRPT